jgi:CcmD family protein
MILGVTTAEKYVAAAYGIVFLIVLVFVLIIALKLGRLERELDELTGKMTCGSKRSSRFAISWASEEGAPPSWGRWWT